MTKWKVIESNENRTRWANYKTMTEIRATRLAKNLYSVALLRTKEYGSRNKKPSDVYVEPVRGSTMEVAEKVKWVKDNLENLLQEEEENVFV